MKGEVIVSVPAGSDVWCIQVRSDHPIGTTNTYTAPTLIGAEVSEGNVLRRLEREFPDCEITVVGRNRERHPALGASA